MTAPEPSAANPLDGDLALTPEQRAGVDARHRERCEISGRTLPDAAIADRRECMHGYPLSACEVAGCPDTIDSEWEAGEVVDRR